MTPEERLPKLPNLYVHAGNRATTRVQGGHRGMPKAWRPIIRVCMLYIGIVYSARPPKINTKINTKINAVLFDVV